MQKNSKKLFLHIGAGKTGTSALQAQLVLNRKLLDKYNYYYPQAKNDATAKEFKITSGNAIELGLLLRDENIPEKNIVNSITKFVIDAKGQNIILSSEVLEGYIATNIITLKNAVSKLGYTVIVIYYVRSIADHLVSLYHQRLKRHHFKGTPSQHILNSRNRFLRVIQTSVKIFGKENVLVKNYDKVKENIFLDFIQNVLCLVDINEFNIVNKTVNRSLTDFEVLLMQYMNTFFTDPKESTFISNALIHQNPNLQYRMSIQKEDLDKVALMYEHDIKKINTYLNENEKPLTMMNNLKIFESTSNKQLNPFQTSVLSILAEITKEIKK